MSGMKSSKSESPKIKVKAKISGGPQMLSGLLGMAGRTDTGEKTAPAPPPQNPMRNPLKGLMNAMKAKAVGTLAEKVAEDNN